MSSFLQTVLSVLAGQEEIAELPQDTLLALDRPGTIVRDSLPVEVLLKIARLQTLKLREADRGEMPDFSEIKKIAAEDGRNATVVMAQSLAVQEDTTRRVVMLEQLITEVVRESIPKEVDNLGVDYFVGPSGRLYFCPVLQRRFLD